MSNFEKYLEAAQDTKTDFPEFTEEDGFKLISAYDLDEFLEGSKYDNSEVDAQAKEQVQKIIEENKTAKTKKPVLDFDYVKFSIITRQWAKDNNAFYYGRPREDFNIYTAKRLAEKAGQSIIILDDMS